MSDALTSRAAHEYRNERDRQERTKAGSRHRAPLGAVTSTKRTMMKPKRLPRLLTMRGRAIRAMVQTVRSATFATRLTGRPLSSSLSAGGR